MRKNLRVFGILMIFIAATVVAASNPFKVTNPSNPRFEAANFKFEDYSISSELAAALRKIIPINSSKNEVDAILVEHLGAVVVSSSEKNKYAYRYTSRILTRLYAPFDWIIVAQYSSDMKLQTMGVQGVRIH